MTKGDATMPTRCSAAKIRALMHEQLMTAVQLADKAGISPSTLTRIFGDPDYRTSDQTVNLLAKALNCSPFDLLQDAAVDAMIRAENEQAVSEVVTEAVAEALTVVVDELAPGDTPEQIADAVPHIQAAVPPVLDVASYIEHIKATCEARVQEVIARLNDMRKARNTWRVLALIAILGVIGLTWYFVWEILNPDKGLTSILWSIYNTKAIPGVTPNP